MGRGRQKAKQTKVARDLKYHSSSIDVTKLQLELSGEPITAVVGNVDDDEDDDPYSSYYDEDDDGPTNGYASSS